MRYHQDIRQPPGSQYLCLTRRDTLISPPFALLSPHSCIHPLPSPNRPKPVTHVTGQRQTSSPDTKNYGFPKTDAPVARVTMPYQYPLLPRGNRGCRCPLGPKTPLQLLCLLCEPLPPLPSRPPPEPRQSQPGTQPFRALPVGPSSPRGCRTFDPPPTNHLTPHHPQL